MDHCKSMIIDGSPIKVLEVDVKPSIIEEPNISLKQK